jgi:hypothetical protein
MGRVDAIDRHVTDLEADLAALIEVRRDQILDHLLLAVDRDRPARHELLEGDPMAPSAEPQLDAVVHHALAQQPLSHARSDEGVHRPLLKDACPDPVLDVLAAARLKHHRGDAPQPQQTG